MGFEIAPRHPALIRPVCAGLYARALPVDHSFLVAADNNLIMEQRHLPNGEFWLVIAGDFARPYVVETSTNPVDAAGDELCGQPGESGVHRLGCEKPGEGVIPGEGAVAGACGWSGR